MKTWKRKGYEVVEKEFDRDLHEFDVIKNGEVIATITPGSIEDMQQIIEDLDSGECVDGWEDGMGNTISIEAEIETFTIEAEKYFEVDAEKLRQIKPGDMILVTVNHKDRTADYIWYSEDENPANHPANEDDYDGVMSFLEERVK